MTPPGHVKIPNLVPRPTTRGHILVKVGAVLYLVARSETTLDLLISQANLARCYPILHRAYAQTILFFILVSPPALCVHTICKLIDTNTDEFV